MVAGAFSLGTPTALVGPVAHGRLGSIWRLETDRGRFAVKVSREEPHVEQVERDAAYQAAFRAAGVPMPRVHRTSDGSVLAPVAGRAVRVYGWVDVAGADRWLDPAAVGRLLAVAHSVDLPVTKPVDGWYIEGLGADGWAALVDELFRGGAPFAGEVAALVPRLLELEQSYAAPAAPAICHRDLWADNLRAVAAPGVGGLVALDWENAGPAGREQELAALVFEYGLGDPGRMRTLVAAYEDAGGPGRLRGPADLTMLLAQQGNIAREGCRRWLAATTDRDRADNEAWVRELLDEPVLADTVEAILSAARPSS